MSFGEITIKSTEKKQFPQSYMKFKNQIIQNIRDCSPGILSCYHKERIRKDYNEEYTEKSCLKNSGNGTILIDQLLTELSYKLGFTPKYGA